jgi:transcriptional regulator with XRE-family HTH domain
MPPRSRPTARQERLGIELRKMREAAGVTARDAAGLLGTNPMQMSHMETGRAGISEERLRRLASNYACPDQELINGLVTMATDRTRGWWEDYRGVLPPAFLDLSELEHHATFLCVIGIVHVPGILQTEDYARAVFSHRVPELPPCELNPRVEHRMRRRVVIDGVAPLRYETIIHEAALRIRVGSRAQSRDQLRAILEASERAHVTVRVIPLDRDGFAGAYSSMLHAGGSVPQLDTVQQDGWGGSGFLYAEAQLASSRALFSKVGDASLDAEKSRSLIARLMRNL